MKIVVAYPPNIDAIDAVFHVRGKPVIFTWGDTIYSPMGAHCVTAELKAHEGVHYSRQTNDTAKIEAWWERYLVDPQFRLEEEIPAHRAEYKQFCAMRRDYNERARFLHIIGDRLGGPLYGGILAPAAARKKIAA